MRSCNGAPSRAQRAPRLRLRRLLLAAAILVQATVLLGQTPRGQGNRYLGRLDTPVEGVLYTNLRTIDVLRDVAGRYHLMIGVSGVAIGDDSFHINVDVRRGTIRDVLDAVVREDARYHWELRRDGSISVTIGALLVLPDVPLQSVDIEGKRRIEMAKSMLGIPEVAGWLRDSRCLLDQIVAITGRPPREAATVTLHVRDEPLWAALNSAAMSSGQYFWSLVQYSDQPCRINLGL